MSTPTRKQNNTKPEKYRQPDTTPNRDSITLGYGINNYTARES